MHEKNDYIEHPWLYCGLIYVCDVCGKPLLKHQKLGKRASNDALCHADCLYYLIGKRKVSYDEYDEYLAKKNKKRSKKCKLLN